MKIIITMLLALFLGGCFTPPAYSGITPQDEVSWNFLMSGQKNELYFWLKDNNYTQEDLIQYPNVVPAIRGKVDGMMIEILTVIDPAYEGAFILQLIHQVVSIKGEGI